MLCCGSLAAKEPGLAGMLLESGLASACRSQGCVGSACSMLCCCGLFDFFNNQSSKIVILCRFVALSVSLIQKVSLFQTT